jgi:hypothetical protein
MPVTLAQAQVNVQNAIDYAVIDNLRRYSWLMDQVTFDDSVNPGTGGGTLTYGYTRLSTAAPAQFRSYNTEFVPGQATRARFTVDLKPLGGAFTLDRDLANLGAAASNEITFQLQQLMTSIRIRFEQELILGDTAVDATGFDGLSKALTGTVTEKTANYVAGSNDWTAATIAGNVATANTRLDELDDFLSLIVPSHTGSGDQGQPGAVPPGTRAVLGNTKLIARVRSVVRNAGSYTNIKDSMGRQIESYNGWNLVDIGDRYDGSAPIIPTTATLTDLYAVTFGLDAFHGVSKVGTDVLRSWMPDFTTAGAVKSGEVQMGPIAMVLKNTKSAGVLRSIKVA